MFSCRISVENIEIEFSSLYVRIKTLEEKVQGDQELLQQLEPFLQVTQPSLCNTSYTQTYRKLDPGQCTFLELLTQVLQMITPIKVCNIIYIETVCLMSQSSARTLQDLKRRRLDLRKEGNTLIDFFCEDKDTFKLDECFRIFQDFCNKFNKAVKVGLNERFWVSCLRVNIVLYLLRRLLRSGNTSTFDWMCLTETNKYWLIPVHTYIC